MNIHEFNESFFDIPFENSAFQTAAFVIAAQQTPARAYRAIGLKMSGKIQAVQEYQSRLQLEKIEIERKERKIKSIFTGRLKRRELRIEIEKIKNNRVHAKKLLNDALIELRNLKAWLDRFPRYTREQFENQELEYFNRKFEADMKGLNTGGIYQSICAMNHLPVFEKTLDELLVYEKTKLEQS